MPVMAMTHEERLSRLEGAFEMFAAVVNNMVTREELRASIEGLRAEMHASMDSLRAEMRAEIREAELRIIRWNIGTVFGAATLIVAVLKLWP